MVKVVFPAQSALPDAYAIELVAAFEESLAAEEADADEDEGSGDDDALEPDEYVVESLLERRMNCRTGRYEYLVRWEGFLPAGRGHLGGGRGAASRHAR